MRFPLQIKTGNAMNDNILCELIYGKGAHVDPVACVEDLSAELAARRVAGYPHSIGQIVLHMNYWMDYEFRKIAGENPRNPDHAIESWPQHPEPTDRTQWQAADSQWQSARQHFIDDLAKLASIADSDAATLDRLVSDVSPEKIARQTTVRATLWQIVAHNSYHAGQIALLRRQFGSWPPARGGDTW
ncbi:MAG: DinB family protein [Terriglobales bacterium]